MRSKIESNLNEFRQTHPVLGSSQPGSNRGYFEIGALRITSGGSGDKWEHVSVSCADRTPTWEEMNKVKDLFWSAGETVLQFHPRREGYVNTMEYCLHLWKQRGKDHPLPPQKLIR